MADETERKIGEITVRIERTICIGSGNCAKVAPELFELDDEGVAAFGANASETSAETVLEACEVCPVEALFAIAADGTQRVP